MVLAEEIAVIAKLARLELNAQELAALPAELTAVLGHMEALAKVTTDGVEPMVYGTAPASALAATSLAETSATSRELDLVARAPDELPAVVAVSGSAQVRAMQFVVPNVLPGQS